MPKPSGNTSVLQPLLDRLAKGDQRAADELIEQAMERLQRLAKSMLRNNPAVHRWMATDDVFQNSLIRLNRALKEVELGDVRSFINLAATQIRRELIDLNRHYYGPEGLGKNCKSGLEPGDFEEPADEKADEEGTIWELRRIKLHEGIEKLPPEEAEVIKLTIYLDLDQSEIANRMGVSIPTVRRRLRAAKLKLHDLKDVDELK